MTEKMTENEAIEVIKSNRPTSGYVLLNEALGIAINALGKQIPNEPIIDSYCLFTSYTCPVCRHEVELSDYYCRCCGQKIRKTTNNLIGMMKNEV